MTDDVVVVGGGLEGYIAALTAAQTDPGASVSLVDPDPERFRQASGLVDVLGYIDGEGPLVSPFSALASLPDSHPYSRVGVETVRDALAAFDAVTGEQYAGDSTEENALVPTPTGSVLPATRYPAGMSSGLASDDRKMLLLGFEQVSAFDAYLASDRLAETVPLDVSGVSASFPGTVRASPVATECARRLDENAETDDGVPVREALVDTVRPYLDIEPRVGFPAVLGETTHETIRETLSDRLQAEIFEVPLGAPSLPGVRLGHLLADAAAEAGVSLHRDGDIVGVETEGQVDGVVVDHGEGSETHEGEQFVLATGGLGVGGLTSDRERIREPLFDCHVEQSDRSGWTAAEHLGDHPFASAGVAVDGRLRPLTVQDEPQYDNLRAAGGVLCGANAPAQKAQGGIAVATGYGAGLRAIESAP